MKNSLKTKLQKAVLLATAAVAVNSAQATFVNISGTSYHQGDLLAGFSTGSGNDLIIDLGSASTALVSGNAWILNAYLPANLVGLNNVNWGIVGVSATGGLTYSSIATGGSVPTVGNPSAFGTIRSQAGGLGSLVGSVGYGTPLASEAGNGSWNNGTVVGGVSTWANAYSFPNSLTSGTFSSGYQDMSADFYSTAINPGAQTQLGNFYLANYNGTQILSYDIAPVPEPSTSALFLCSSGGLILMALRRKFPRKA